MVSRKLLMQTLRKLHFSNRLYIEQVTCHTWLLLSARACSETTKQNSDCFEIYQIPVNWFALQIGWLLSFRCVKCEDFNWFLGGEFSFGRTVFVWVAHESVETKHFFLFVFYLFIYLNIYFFSTRIFRQGFCIWRGVISKHIILFFFVFELALSRWNLLKVDIN